ncbi:hypothetical protein V8C40DRAFT_158715 [Trichoderma camerunense]
MSRVEACCLLLFLLALLFFVSFAHPAQKLSDTRKKTSVTRLGKEAGLKFQNEGGHSPALFPSRHCLIRPSVFFGVCVLLRNWMCFMPVEFLVPHPLSPHGQGLDISPNLLGSFFSPLFLSTEDVCVSLHACIKKERSIAYRRRYGGPAGPREAKYRSRMDAHVTL